MIDPSPQQPKDPFAFANNGFSEDDKITIQLTANGAGFQEYDSLDPKIATDAKNVAQAIRQLTHNIADHVVEIGTQLITIKAKLPGKFIAWVEAEFAWSAQTARAYMRAARAAQFGYRSNEPSETKHYWLTPPEKLAELYRDFDFDFDSCPHPVPRGFDGLSCEWGLRTYCNPLFTECGAWANKAITEHRKGKLVVIVLPICAMGSIARLLVAGATQYGRLEIPDWRAIEDGSTNPDPPQSRHPCVWLVLKP
jgi:hypothetical protein